MELQHDFGSRSHHVLLLHNIRSCSVLRLPVLLLEVEIQEGNVAGKTFAGVSGTVQVGAGRCPGGAAAC